MLFDTWLQKSKGIDVKTFQLRQSIVQQQMIDEYNEMSKELANKLRQSK